MSPEVTHTKHEQRAKLNVSVASTTQTTNSEDEKNVERIAVIVCHGMGQQVQFETIDCVARQLLRAAEECGTAVIPAAAENGNNLNKDIEVSIHPSGEEFIGRAKLSFKKPDESIVEVHLYEAYWAPLTESRVTLFETLSFFVDAGRRGLRFANVDGFFDRWMFGGRREFQIPPRRIIQIGIGLWMLFLLTASIVATGLTLFLGLTIFLRFGGDIGQLAIADATAMWLGLLLLGNGIVTVIAAQIFGSREDAKPPTSKKNENIGATAPSAWKRIPTALLLWAIVQFGAYAALAGGKRTYSRWLLPAVSMPPHHWISVAAFLFLGAEIFALWKVKSFLIQFAGDVAAYVSPYKVSKFEEIRTQIQERGRKVARFIYSATKPDGLTKLYDTVMFVGHSLGSVVAYDTLNDALNRDLHEGGWEPKSRERLYEVAKRTKLLLTFGSPLDKTAFIFRTQKTQMEIDVREALAAAKQPLVLGYENRPDTWINLWSRSDWISGPLAYYDDIESTTGVADTRRVRNIENGGSTFPSSAHTEYWEGPLFRGVLHAALVGVCPCNVPRNAQTAVAEAFAGCTVQQTR